MIQAEYWTFAERCCSQKPCVAEKKMSPLCGNEKIEKRQNCTLRKILFELFQWKAPMTRAVFVTHSRVFEGILHWCVFGISWESTSVWEPTEWLSEPLFPSPIFFNLLRRLSVSRNPYLLLITGTSMGSPALDLKAPVPRLHIQNTKNKTNLRHETAGSFVSH